MPDYGKADTDMAVRRSSEHMQIAPLKHLPALVMFDLDGTLVDSVPDIALAVDAMLVDLGLPKAGQEQVRRWVGNGAERLVQRALVAGDETQISTIPPAVLEQAMAVFMDHYTEVNGRHSVLYPHVRRVLRQLQQAGIALAVVTNKPKHFADELLQSLEIESLFAMVVGGECVKRKKPEPDALLWVASQMGVAPQDALMIGDSCNDVGAARAGGIAIICVSYGYNHGQPIADSNPDRVIDCFSELVRFDEITNVN